MRIIKPSFEILPRDGLRGNIATIELAARTCYKTEDHINEGSADSMVAMLISRKHEAMLEHGDYLFALESASVASAIRVDMLTIEGETGQHIRLNMTRENDRYIISGNARAWRDFMAARCASAWYFAGHIDPLFLPESFRGQTNAPESGSVKPITYADLKGPVEQRAHLRQTVRFIIDRGVSHEFVRHRGNDGFAFAQESTRFCNYSEDRFGKEITVIEPCFLVPDTESYSLWKRSCMAAETEYFTLLNMGLQQQEARAVLPTSTKTELVMSGTLGDWQHFFDLRALHKTGKPHPQAYEVAKPLFDEMVARFPGAITTD